MTIPHKDVARSAAQQNSIIPGGWKPSFAEPIPVIRCTAIKINGERCKRWSLRGTNICVFHGGRLPNVQEHAAAVVESARIRLVGLTDLAIDQIEDLITNASGEAIRLKAAQDVLDRAGVRGAIEIEVTHSETETAAIRINRRLEEIALRQANAAVFDDDDDIIDVDVDEEEYEEENEEENDIDDDS